MTAIRSPIKYHGGKSQLAKKQVIYEPRHYTVFGDCCVGGGSYLTVADRLGVSEFANDMDGMLLNFFRVLQNDVPFDSMMRKLLDTPFCTAEFEFASGILESPEVYTSLTPNATLAWAFFVVNRMSRQGLGKDFATRTRRTRRNRNENCSAYLSAIDQLNVFRDRLRWVELRQMDVLDFIKLLDGPQAFFYIDPPYLIDTRVAGEYTVEMDEAQHKELLDLIRRIEGRFMLCGYESEMYSQMERDCGWNRIEFQSTKSSSSASTKPVATEIIWRNYQN